MIKGVKIKKLIVHQDIPDAVQKNIPKGILIEVLRDDDNLLKKFGQTTFTVSHRGAIKAFHYHEKQDDIWFVATGKVKIVLYDNRRNSRTKGETQVLFAGENDYKIILIPKGVFHGYQVLSKKPVLLFYHLSKHYNPEKPDEGRIAYDDPLINFDWGSKV